MKQILLSFIIISSFNAAFCQNNKLSGIYTEYKRTLWNGDDGSKYTIDGKPFEPKLQFEFMDDSNVITYDGSKKREQTYTVDADTLTLSMSMGIRSIFTKYIIIENKNELTLKEFNNNLDKGFFLKEYHFKKSKSIQQDYLTKNNFEVYTVVNEMPEFPGGMEEMRKFISNEVSKSTLKGDQKVFLKLLISPEGKILNLDVLNNPRVEYMEEAVKITRKFPDFTPGKQNGKPVYVYYNFPVKFVN